MEQAAKAPFDEKLIISLILAKLDVEFKAYAQKEDYLEVLFGELKAFKRSLEGKAEAGEMIETVPQTPIAIFPSRSRHSLRYPSRNRKLDSHEVGKVSLCRYHSGHEPVSTDCESRTVI